MMEKPLYFAYGSNINLDQMQYRCPDATVYGQAVLDNYDLRFRGSGVATVEPKEGACVYGLLWELTDKCETSLDRYEGYPRLYIKQTLEVRTFDGQRVPVMAYIMNPEVHLKPSLPPRDYYLGINILLPARVILQRDVCQLILSARIVRPVFVHTGVFAVNGQRSSIPIPGKP